MSAPVHTFVSVEEDKHTLTVHYRTRAGELDKITFSARGEPEGYELVTVGVGGRRSEEKQHVDKYLRKDGAEAVEIFQVTNEEGNKVKDGIHVTHYIVVELPQEDAHRLMWQLHDFMDSAADLVERLSRCPPKIESVSYGDDYVAISYSRYRTLKLGFAGAPHRFTFTLYGRSEIEGESGQLPTWFGFKDENGKPFHVEFSVPSDEIDRIDHEIGAFIKAHKNWRNPKFEAAVIPYVFQYAA